MPDNVQRVKYVVEVDATELDSFKQKLDGLNSTVITLNTSFGQLKTNVDQGLLKAIATMNARLSRTATVGKNAAQALGDIAAPLAGLKASADSVSKVFNDLSTDLKSIIDDLKRVNDELKKVKRDQGEAGESSKRFGLGWLRAFGVFQSAKYTITGVFDGIKEGAQNLDLDRILTKQVEGFQNSIAKAQELTAGVVARSDLTRSFALMSSFGIPMGQFAENMELVQKMAIRTGQSADFLTESFARGISRLSPLILDNLGIQVSLGEANEAYANSTGKLVEELTKEEKIAGLTAQVLGKLETATKGVDLRTSQAASIMRVETAWKDAVDWLKAAGGVAIGAVDEIFESASSSAHRFVEGYEPGIAALRSTGEFLNKMGANGSEVLAHARAWEAYHAAFKAFGQDEDMADLFGDNGIFGTTGNQIQSVMNEQEQAFRSYLNFLQQTRTVMGSGAMDIMGSRGDTTAERIGGVFALFQQHTESTLGAYDQISSKFKDILSQQDLLNLKKKAEADASLRAKQAYEAAVMANKATGIPLATALALIYENQAENLAEARAEIEKAVVATAIQAAANKSMNTFYQAGLMLAKAQTENAQRLFDLREGATLVEIDFNRTVEQRNAILKSIEDLEKQIAENAQDSEAQIAILKEQGKLRDLDNLREVMQAEKRAEKEKLDAYKNASNAKILADIKLMEAAVQMFALMAKINPAQGVAESMASMQTMIDRMRGMLHKGGGSGGGGSKEEFTAFKKQVTSKPTYYGWSVEDLTAAAGQLQSMRDSLSLPGEMEGGFLGTSKFFGVMGPEDLEKAKTQLDELRKARNAAINRFGVENTDILNPFGDPDKVDAFEARLEAMVKHFEALGRAAEPINQMATALGTLESGMVGLFDAFSGLSSGLTQFTEALLANKDAYTLTLAAMPAIRSFTKGLTDNRKAQAGVEALMQGAAAWAAYAVGNIPGGVMHTTAAAMYLAVAGGALNLPKGKGKSDKPKDDNSRVSQAKMRDIHLHFDGIIPQTEAERGVMIQSFIREAQRAGL